jgi:hypothetical protein
MPIPSQPTDILAQETMLNEASDLLLACLSSVPRDKINPKTYWPWAQKALKVAGDGGTTYERMVSIMHRELQMGSTPFHAKACNRIYSIGISLKARENYQDFRRMVRDHAPYIIVLARVRKEEMKTKSPDRDDEWLLLESEE